MNDNRKRFRQSRKKNLVLPIAATAMTVVMSVALASFFFNLTRNANRIVNAENDIQNGETSVAVDNNLPEKEKVTDNVLLTDNEEMRGVWIPSVSNIAYPSKTGLSEKELKKEIDAILNTCVDTGLGTVFFQVRPSADALYKSDIFPWSEFLSGEQGKAPDKEFDSLEYILKRAGEKGIEVHAWVNPFRITMGTATKPKTNPEELSEGHPARIHPEYTVAYADGKLYFNPGIPEVRALVVSGISELCEKYPTLSGIHIDDYFYPYPYNNEEFDDEEAYKTYAGGMDKAEWRRENVNSFVKDAYTAVKNANPDMRFGVSPFGIWANSGSDTPVDGSETKGLEAYSALYCDALSWAKGGYVDYLVPQIYWNFGHSAAPFDNVARWWNANLDGTGVDFYIGHAVYKAVDYPENEIPAQVEFGRSLLTYKGSVFYGYSDIEKNNADLRSDLRELFSVGIKEEEPISNGTAPTVTYPTSTNTSDNATYILGVSDPTVPVEIDGRRISRTKDGYFSYYTTLETGGNTFNITSGGKASGFTITKKQTSTAFVPPKELETFEITECKPSKTTWISQGDTIEVSCSAPSGSKVTAQVGGITVDLKPTMYSATTSKNYREVYKGSMTITALFAPDGGEAELGTLIFRATKNGKSAEKRIAPVVQLGKGALIYAEVKNDYSYFKTEYDSSFYDDPTPQQIGMRDYIVGYVGGYYKLRSGYYVSEDDVKVVRDDALYDNKILTVTVEANVKNTTNNKDNFTDIRFGVIENIPVTAEVISGRLVVTLHNTDSTILPEVVISRNPLIEAAECYISEEGNPTYEFILRNSENFYGFNTVYDDGFAILRLNNPQSLSHGDKPLSGKTIILDAGHGGDDIGAPGPSGINSGLNEADLNLAITLELRDALAGLGANVVMTRTDDSTLDLYSRIDIMASMIPDLAISIHHNSVANLANAQKTRGYLGLYSSDAGVMLAEAVADTVTSRLSRQKRPTSYQMLAVARNHRFPSTLCEMSFICNIEEFQWTVSPGNYKRSADAVAEGVLEFYRRQAEYLRY